MALRRILRIDDPDDKKTLKTRCHPVRLPNPGLRQLVADMFETMHAANGVGLAAPQVGITQRLTVIYIPPEVEEREDGSVDIPEALRPYMAGTTRIEPARGS